MYNPNILVVDDDAEIRNLIECHLQAAGKKAICADSVAKALKVVEATAIDIAILDIMLPDGSGTEIARTLKQRATDMHPVPIIFLSALSDRKTKIEGLHLADDYITKPFDFDELIARVHLHLARSQSQYELFESKQYYKLLYDAAAYMYVSLNDSGVVEDCNKRFCEFIGMPKARLYGADFLQWLCTEEREAFVPLLSKQSMQSVAELDFCLQLDQKRKKHVECSISCITHSDQSVHFLVALNDVTEKKQIERLQKIARKELYRSARLASIGTLANGVAHELNNPLAAILGFSSALVERSDAYISENASEVKQYLKHVVSECLRCRDIIKNLSFFAADVELCIEKNQLRSCFLAAQNLVASGLRSKNINIINTIGAHEYELFDKSKLVEVLVHILSNILDFCPRGTEVSVCQKLEAIIENYDLVVVADFGHGLMQDRVRELVQEKAKFLALNCQTNSNNHGFNIIDRQYQRVDAFSLDEQELLLSAGKREMDSPSELASLQNRLGAEYAWLTRGANETIGIKLHEPAVHIPVLEKQVTDTVGAGDALFSLVALSACMGLDVKIATFLGQLAGAQAVNIIGNASGVKRDVLLKGGMTLLSF